MYSNDRSWRCVTRDLIQYVILPYSQLEIPAPVPIGAIVHPELRVCALAAGLSNGDCRACSGLLAPRWSALPVWRRKVSLSWKDRTHLAFPSCSPDTKSSRGNQNYGGHSTSCEPRDLPGRQADCVGADGLVEMKDNVLTSEVEEDGLVEILDDEIDGFLCRGGDNTYLILSVSDKIQIHTHRSDGADGDELERDALDDVAGGSVFVLFRIINERVIIENNTGERKLVLWVDWKKKPGNFLSISPTFSTLPQNSILAACREAGSVPKVYSDESELPEQLDSSQKVHDPFAWGGAIVVLAVLGSHTSVVPMLCELPGMVFKGMQSACNTGPPTKGIMVHHAATSPLYCEHGTSVKKLNWVAFHGSQFASERSGNWATAVRMAKEVARGGITEATQMIALNKTGCRQKRTSREILLRDEFNDETVGKCGQLRKSGGLCPMFGKLQILRFNYRIRGERVDGRIVTEDQRAYEGGELIIGRGFGIRCPVSCMPCGGEGPGKLHQRLVRKFPGFWPQKPYIEEGLGPQKP
ncbi:hypothetical protein B0H19DRAFT_1086005 [Mycena capillaripes]|nr:hypothetical protein B0H19DRAFT_1086005 [Mycena capillaripes]